MDATAFLKEDLGHGDITSDALMGDVEALAKIIAKEDCILAGLEEATAIFQHLGVRTESEHRDGQRVEKGATVMRLNGRARPILAGERVALNFLMRMSGIATVTWKLVDKCREKNPNVSVAATRKTTPGFRFFEKKAVMLGGGDPHRFRLDDAFLIKDNHLKVVGSVKEAVKRAKAGHFNKKVEVEVETEEEALEAARAEADIIMLDNMPPDVGRVVAGKIREISSCTIEVSGGINPQNIVEYADYADVISLGWITHSVRAVDFSLEIEEISKKGLLERATRT
ncbi:MAG: carboxylating nicotinate-nucleotide diphosphorylase [Thermoplasmata archaeon]|nr:carboxylating nicotinate-nucleotide diphosphorylase [Thermoplasmata archaeon]